jgi:hypothetical protein
MPPTSYNFYKKCQLEFLLRTCPQLRVLRISNLFFGLYELFLRLSTAQDCQLELLAINNGCEKIDEVLKKLVCESIVCPSIRELNLSSNAFAFNENGILSGETVAKVFPNLRVWRGDRLQINVAEIPQLEGFYGMTLRDTPLKVQSKTVKTLLFLPLHYQHGARFPNLMEESNNWEKFRSYLKSIQSRVSTFKLAIVLFFFPIPISFHISSRSFCNLVTNTFWPAICFWG